MTAKDEATTPTLDDSIEPTPRPDSVETMKAIVHDGYGSEPEDVLRLADTPAGGSSSSAARPTDAGSAASTASSGRSCCPPS
jgi:hypothetical protein